jgi:hypothetical protein
LINSPKRVRLVGAGLSNVRNRVQAAIIAHESGIIPS